jgi:hypothetical protein
MRHLVVLLLTACAAHGAPRPTRSDACKGAAGFDYWVGDWIVRPTAHPERGPMASVITLEQDGCVVRERWTGRDGYTGTSFTTFDTARGVWHQTWVDNAGGLAVMEGGLDDAGELVLHRVALPGDPDPARRRMSYRRRAGGGVRQIVERSDDGGATWTVTIDLTYVRR